MPQRQPNGNLLLIKSDRKRRTGNICIYFYLRNIPNCQLFYLGGNYGSNYLLRIVNVNGNIFARQIHLRKSTTLIGYGTPVGSEIFN